MASFLAELLKLARRPAMWLVVGVWMTLSLVFSAMFVAASAVLLRRRDVT